MVLQFQLARSPTLTIFATSFSQLHFGNAIFDSQRNLDSTFLLACSPPDSPSPMWALSVRHGLKLELSAETWICPSRHFAREGRSDGLSCEFPGNSNFDVRPKKSPLPALGQRGPKVRRENCEATDRAIWRGGLFLGPRAADGA